MAERPVPTLGSIWGCGDLPSSGERSSPLLSLVIRPKPQASPLESLKQARLVPPLLCLLSMVLPKILIATSETLALDGTELATVGIKTFLTQWHPGRTTSS